MDSILYKPKLHSIDKSDITILISPEAPNWVAVNKVGVKVLDLIDGSRTSDEIARILEPSNSKDDVYSFIKECISRELVATRPFLFSSYSGRSKYLKARELEELWIYVTNRCNLFCEHCLVDANSAPKKELNNETLKKIIKEGVDLGAKRIFFTGGEPFLKKDIFELIEFVTLVLEAELVILTNGTLLDEQKVHRLTSLPGIVLQVSLEGSSPDINDSIRGKGNYHRTLKTIEILRKHGIRTIVTSTSTKKNIADIPRLNRLLHSKDVRTHHILWVHKRGRAAKNPVSVHPKKLINLMKNLRDNEIKVDNWESFKARVNGKRGGKVDGCNAAFSSLSIDSNGGVYPCPSLNGDKRFLMGNIKAGIHDIWLNSDMAKQFREISVAKIQGCKVCEFKFFCGGGCRCHAYFASERPSLYSKDPYCDVIKNMIVESILDFVSPNGLDKPEILGHMGESSMLCDNSSASGSFEVSSFHCNCVLDVTTREQVSNRYRSASDNPERDLCCPTDYTASDLNGLPVDTISISYGCGNPTAFGDLKEGESVLDIGSGGGIDCFIAAKKVGRSGRVIGVDMTDEMLQKANQNREKMTEVLGFEVVEFRKGIVEELPVESSSIDLVISNCVINLSPDKKKVFEDIFRVLKSGGRFSISDIVSDAEIPEEMKQDPELWSGCISGALTKEGFISAIESAGFKGVKIEKSFFWKKVQGIEFHSVTIRGVKP
jgi:radical SAM protein with 4Fe4S-binding SPASM domain